MPTAVSKTAPSIFGQTLGGPMEGHEPLLPASLHHWDLHVALEGLVPDDRVQLHRASAGDGARLTPISAIRDSGVF